MLRTVKRLAILAFAVLLGGAVVIAVTLRVFISHDSNRWHVDPLSVSAPSESSSDLILPPNAPRFGVGPIELRTALGEVMAAQPRTRLLATSEEGAVRTWVTTSAVMAFPDYTSVRVLPLDDPNTSTLAIFARARFGQNDLGVNRDRNSEILRGLVERVGSVG